MVSEGSVMTSLRIVRTQRFLLSEELTVEYVEMLGVSRI